MATTLSECRPFLAVLHGNGDSYDAACRDWIYRFNKFNYAEEDSVSQATAESVGTEWIEEIEWVEEPEE